MFDEKDQRKELKRILLIHYAGFGVILAGYLLNLFEPNLPLQILITGLGVSLIVLGSTYTMITFLQFLANALEEKEND